MDSGGLVVGILCHPTVSSLIYLNEWIIPGLRLYVYSLLSPGVFMCAQTRLVIGCCRSCVVVAAVVLFVIVVAASTTNGHSYKLWNQYLGERRAAVEGKCITDPACKIVVNAHERALVRIYGNRWKRERERGGGGWGVTIDAPRIACRDGAPLFLRCPNSSHHTQQDLGSLFTFSPSPYILRMRRGRGGREREKGRSPAVIFPASE